MVMEISTTMLKNTAILVLVVGSVLVPNLTESASTRAAPAPAVDCSSLVLNMADCLSFVTNGSTEQKPEGTCCSGLKSVLKTDAQCVCEAFKNSAQLGITLNITKALTLPTACHVSAPSLSSCGMSVGTGAAPAMSPMALSPSSTAAAPTDTGGLGNEVPAPAPTPVPGSGSGSGTSGSSALAFTACSMVMALVGMFLSLV